MRRLMFLLVIGVGGAVILVSLGVWQIQRLGWKQDLLLSIESRIAADPVALPDDLIAERDRYLPVRVTGRFDDEALRVLASRRHVGAVYRIIRPFALDDGRRVLVDVGWIRDEAGLPETPTANVTLVGNLHWPREIDGFTPEPDIAANIWFARDVDTMSRALQTEPALIVLRASDASEPGISSWPVDTAGIPNDHLQYAITWFSLALIWLGMTIFFFWRDARRNAPAA